MSAVNNRGYEDDHGDDGKWLQCDCDRSFSEPAQCRRVAIAASSLLTEMIQGKALTDVQDITPEMITAALGGLPKVKLHAASLAEEALKEALEHYGASHG